MGAHPSEFRKYRDGEIVEVVIMTDEQVMQDNGSVSEGSAVSNVQAEAPAIEATQAPAGEMKPQKMLSQDEVNKLVSGIKKETEEKIRAQVKREALEAQNQALQRPIEKPANGSQANAQSPEVIAQEVRRQMQLEQQQAASHAIAHDFFSKLEAARDADPQFEQTVKDLNLGALPMPVVGVLNSIDNIGEILSDIHSRAPDKFINLVTTIQYSPNLGKKALMDIANAIKANKEAAQAKQAPAPLSQIKPSITATDNGSMSVRDYKKADWLRG